MNQPELLVPTNLTNLSKNRLFKLRIAWVEAVKRTERLQKNSKRYTPRGESRPVFTGQKYLKARDIEMGLFSDLCDYLEYFDPFVGLWDKILGVDKETKKEYNIITTSLNNQRREQWNQLPIF